MARIGIPPVPSVDENGGQLFMALGVDYERTIRRKYDQKNWFGQYPFLPLIPPPPFAPLSGRIASSLPLLCCILPSQVLDIQPRGQGRRCLLFALLDRIPL